jgi:hypothetical protein
MADTYDQWNKINHTCEYGQSRYQEPFFASWVRKRRSQFVVNIAINIFKFSGHHWEMYLPLGTEDVTMPIGLRTLQGWWCTLPCSTCDTLVPVSSGPAQTFRPSDSCNVCVDACFAAIFLLPQACWETLCKPESLNPCQQGELHYKISMWDKWYRVEAERRK